MVKKFALVAASVLMAGCVQITINGDDFKDNGPATTRTYVLDGSYHELEVSHAFDVTMSDTATTATVTLDSALFEKLVFGVENGTLKIALKPGVYHNIQHASVMLPYNSRIDDIELCGASSFSTKNSLVSEEVSVDLSGASHFEGVVDHVGGELDIDLSGASTATVSGTTGKLDLELSGASELRCANLDAVNVKAVLSGASTADVLCCERLEAELSGASDMSYRTIADGCDPVVKERTSGSSTLRRR